MEIGKNKMLEMYRMMMLIRKFELKTMELYMREYIRGYLHPYIGEEAVATGVVFALDKSDYITSTHRGHGHCLAKGCSPAKMMAELTARDTGYCRGRGGSMHIFSTELGILGANGIVGGGLPLATGAGLASKIRGDGRVTVCFFGDGATNNGVFHESCNMAAIWKLPVVYVCENNQYAVTTPITESSAVANVADRARAYDIPGIIMDGQDVIDVYEKTTGAVERARRGEGPSLLEAKTYRWTGHHLNDPGTYRPKDEVKAWKARCPLALFKDKLASEWGINEETSQEIEKEIDRTVAEAVDFALTSPEPDGEEFLKEIGTKSQSAI